MDIRTVSRVAGIVTLAVAGVSVAIPLVVTADDEAPAVDQFRDYAAHPGVASAANVILLGMLCLVPAMIYTARAARAGAPKLAFIGGGVSALAWLAGLASLGGVQIALYEGSKLPDQAGGGALIDAVTKDPVYGVLALTFVLGHTVGMTILGIALWRSGAVAWWVGALFVVYVVLHTVGHAVSPAVDLVSGPVLLIALAAVAVRISRTPNDEWDLPAVGGRAAAPVPEPAAVAR